MNHTHLYLLKEGTTVDKKGEFILCAQRTLETPLATKIEIPGRGEGQPQKQIYEDSRLSNGFQHGPSFFETVEN